MTAKRGKGSRLGLLAALLVGVVALSAALWYLAGGFEGKRAASRAEFGDRLRELALRRGAGIDGVAADEAIRKADGIFVRSWRITLPQEEAIGPLAADIEAEAARWEARVTRVEPARLRVDLGVEAFDIRLDAQPARDGRRQPAEATPAATPTATPRPSPRPGARGKLAILLDDAGQQLDPVAPALALPTEVAVAVLPFLPASTEVAVEMHRAGHEVWLHLPMEPENYPAQNPGPGAVLVAMTEEEIRTTVHSALNNVPFAVGVNNHMGSVATADLRAMTWVMQELSARGVFFIDSRTTTATVAETAARSQGVKTNRRHLFLDNQPSRTAVRKQLEEAVYRALTEGAIIAIGHMTNPATIQVLEDELPGLAKRGVELVPPSKLVK